MKLHGNAALSWTGRRRLAERVVVEGWTLTAAARAGKILRGTMRRIADGEKYTTPATIEDLAVLDEISDALERIGYARISTAVRR